MPSTYALSFFTAATMPTLPSYAIVHAAAYHAAAYVTSTPEDHQRQAGWAEAGEPFSGRQGSRHLNTETTIHHHVCLKVEGQKKCRYQRAAILSRRYATPPRDCLDGTTATRLPTVSSPRLISTRHHTR